MTNYSKLEKIYKRVNALNHMQAIAGWDQAVMMPAGGNDARAEAMAELSVMRLELLSQSEMKDLIHGAKSEELNHWQKANLREIEADYLNANSVDKNLVEAKSLAGSKCEFAWRSLRAENNWNDFLPLFKNVVELTKEEAKQRSAATGLSLYDSLLNLYEPDQKSDYIDGVFKDLKTHLPKLIQEVLEKQKSEDLYTPEGPFEIEKQRQLGLELMKAVGFDFEHGRLDVSHHPFCGGVPQDVRLTTRYATGNFIDSLMGVLHETGHACYEQGLPKEWASQPVGVARGMGIHESQSLLFEMQVSRSKEFISYLNPLLKKYFQKPNDEKSWTVENLIRLYTRVKPDYIRVDADELTYPMHVILRYEIEKAVIEDQLQVEDIPEAWNQKMQEYLGISTEGNYKNGCMQDVHWTDGSFGYFPTYTLGAMNAAQIFNAAKNAHAEIPHHIQKGDWALLNRWLKDNVWSKGCLYSIDDLMLNATGEKLNSKYFIEHLKNRYL